jgi:beta-glucanase (GH16 family)
MNKQGWHNRELQYYSRSRPENSALRAGKLIITARRESLNSASDWGGQAYTSARLITLGKAQWTYGFFEVRAKMPCGRGSWPAIWMLGVEGQWPAGGELDILEHMGKRPDWVFSTVHTASGHAANGKGDGRTLNTACSQFHNYQMLWTPTEVRFGVDGVQHAVYVNAGTGAAQWPFDKPQYMILNLAIGGDLGGPVDDSPGCTSRLVDLEELQPPALSGWGHGRLSWSPKAGRCFRSEPPDADGAGAFPPLGPFAAFRRAKCLIRSPAEAEVRQQGGC